MSNLATNQAEEIAYEAAQRPDPADRVAYLQQACSGDVALRSAVDKILAECEAVDRFLDQSRRRGHPDAEVVRLLADASVRPAEGGAGFDADGAVGDQIGPYKLLQKIGEGGCGVVYLAEQEKPVRRRVALKVIKLGMDTKSFIARFEAERQALALMDHPNIARVLDAGATEAGRPYFVMELVPGVKITSYCDQHRLEVHQRLELFIQVCQAIQHAHQKGIAHRDIKPSNILVTMLDGKPLPKVIDFGIAKATTGEPLTDKTLFTAVEQFVGTPAYMSPEQAQMSGLDVDTRCDIYSLGVLLYELLTGKTPFDQADLLQSGLEGMRRTLLEREPHRPSTRLDALREDELTQTVIGRRVGTPQLKLLLQGDLDWIVLKALEKDRNRRYQTANGFALDVQRYLSNEPVLARPPSRFYRLQKLVRRNRAAFAAIAAVSVALIAGFGTSTWLFLREREARHDADRLRVEADARATIAKAALLISRQEMAAADQLVNKVQLPVTQPSLEAAGVFRSLGEWNVSQGRWKVAAECYLNLAHANQLDAANTSEAISRDVLGAGPALIMAGDLERYRQFVQTTLVRFANTTDPVAAEQVIKNSLILPADEITLQRMRPLVAVVEADAAKAGHRSATNNYYAPWQPLALSLYEFRCENFDQAVVWGRSCFDYADQTPARIAMAHIVLAMSYARQNQREQAYAELLVAREPVARRFPEGPTKISDLGWSSDGVWHDWVIAHLLLVEAEKLVP